MRKRDYQLVEKQFAITLPCLSKIGKFLLYMITMKTTFHRTNDKRLSIQQLNIKFID